MKVLIVSLSLFLSPFRLWFANGQATSTKLQVQIPRSLARPGGYDHKEALFGEYPYGASLQQNVYYTASSLCDAGGTLPESAKWVPPYILMVDRGSCTFVKKVRNAQRNGASAVLIADNICLCTRTNCTSNPGSPCEDTEPIMADDGSGTDVSIPSFLVYKEDADPIKQVIQRGESVVVSMSFPLPTPDDRVEYALWTTPSDPLSRAFLSDFSGIAVRLGKNAFFQPHMYVYNGSEAGCRGSNGDNQCFTLCTNNGRYCSTDPDDDLDEGISGADVVKEMLRRICVWREYGADGIGLEWWRYVQEFQYRCGDLEQASYFKDEACVADAMSKAGVNKENIDACMKHSGGLEGNTPNPILENALQEAREAGIVIIPSLTVNETPMRGALQPATVFEAICAGYAQGTEPEVCKICARCSKPLDCAKKLSCDGQSLVPFTPSQSGSSPSSSASNYTTKSSGAGRVSFTQFVASLVLLVSAFGSAAYLYHRREQRQMQDHVRLIMSEYMPLSDNEPNHMPQGSVPFVHESHSGMPNY